MFSGVKIHDGEDFKGRWSRIDPELPFGIGPVNAREVQESGLWPTATAAAAVGRSRTQIEEARAGVVLDFSRVDTVRLRSAMR
jgi:hypothetical protein